MIICCGDISPLFPIEEMIDYSQNEDSYDFARIIALDPVVEYFSSSEINSHSPHQRSPLSPDSPVFWEYDHTSVISPLSLPPALDLDEPFELEMPPFTKRAWEVQNLQQSIFERDIEPVRLKEREETVWTFRRY